MLTNEIDASLETRKKRGIVGILILIGRHPPELPGVNLDFDWIYRRALPRGIRAIVRTGGPLVNVFFRMERPWFENSLRAFRNNTIIGDCLAARGYRKAMCSSQLFFWQFI